MTAREDLENAKAYLAWVHLICGQSWDNPEPLDPAEFMAEFARLISLDAPIPPFARKFLADLAEGQGPFRLVLKPNGKKLQKFETDRRAYEQALEIEAAIPGRKRITAAIKEVLRKKKMANGTTAEAPEPSKDEMDQGFKDWSRAKRFMHPARVENLDRLAKRPRRERPES